MSRPSPVHAADPSLPEFRLILRGLSPDTRGPCAHLRRTLLPDLRTICDARGIRFSEMDVPWSGSAGAEDVSIDDLHAELLRGRTYLLVIVGARNGGDGESNDPLDPLDSQTLRAMLLDPLLAGRLLLYFQDAPAEPAAAQPAAPQGDTTHDDLRELARRHAGSMREGCSDPDTLAEFARADLMQVIGRLFAPVDAAGQLESERRAQEAFGRSRQRAYVEIPHYLDRLDEHAQNPEPPLVVVGESGSGKSALLAYWSDRYRREHPEAFVITCHAGVTASGTDHRLLLRQIMAEIRDRYRLAAELPVSGDEIEQAFPLWLGRIQREKLILVIDALNQLGENSQGLHWLPEYIQPHVRLVVSVTDGSLMPLLEERGWPVLRVRPLSLNERREVVRRYLGTFSQTFSGDQLMRVSSDATSANPLFLRTRLEELRMFGSHDDRNARINYYLEARDLDDLFQRVLARLEEEHGETLVRDVMTLVWGARRGLQDDELLGLTGATSAGLALLLRGLEFHLMRFGGLLAFYHDHLRHAVANRYISNGGIDPAELHCRIAHYFAGQPISPRRSEEQPWQLRQAGAWDELRDCIADVRMFIAIRAGEGTHQLLSYWLAIGEWHDMADAYRESLERYEGEHRQEELPGVLGTLGRFLLECGRYDDAERLCRRALAIREQQPGAMHIDNAATLDDLAALFHHTGRNDEAVKCSRRALEIRAGTFGQEHPETVRNLASFGALLFTVGQLEEAEDLLQQALALNESAGGGELPVVAEILNNLGVLRITAGRHRSAVSYLERACRINEEVLGGEHPEVASNLSNIATALHQEGDYIAAEGFYRRALAISEHVLGPNHPQLAVLLTNLGWLCRELGKLGDAEISSRRALDIRMHALGPDHLETLNSMFRLGRVLMRKGDHQQARALYDESLAGLEKQLGSDHEEMLRLRELATVRG